jgi:hypothetical protein
MNPTEKSKSQNTPESNLEVTKNLQADDHSVSNESRRDANDQQEPVFLIEELEEDTPQNQPAPRKISSHF